MNHTKIELLVVARQPLPGELEFGGRRPDQRCACLEPRVEILRHLGTVVRFQHRFSAAGDVELQFGLFDGEHAGFELHRPKVTEADQTFRRRQHLLGLPQVVRRRGDRHASFLIELRERPCDVLPLGQPRGGQFMFGGDLRRPGPFHNDGLLTE